MSWFRMSVGARRPVREARAPRRSLVVLSLAVLSSLTFVPAARAQDDAGRAFCSLLTANEVSSAFGSKVEAAPGFGDCEWDASGGQGHLMSLYTSWSDMSLADTQAIFPDTRSLTVAGLRSVFSGQGSEAILFVEIAPGILMLDAQVDDAAQARDPLVHLAELAIARSSALPEPPAIVTAGPEPTPDVVATALCGLLTTEEVAAALGADVLAGAPSEASPGVCQWIGSDGTTSLVQLTASWSRETLESARDLGEGSPLTVGGRPAWYTSAVGPALLFLELDQGVLVLAANPADGVDSQMALAALGEVLVSRSTSLPGSSGPSPAA
jgi:hypothetical protein